MSDRGTTTRTFGAVNGPVSTNTLTLTKGEVTQLTSQTTPVTLNAGAGVVTTVAAANATHESLAFTVNNSNCLANSAVLVNVVDYSGAGTPAVTVDNVATGSFDVVLNNSHVDDQLNAAVKVLFLVL